LPLLLKTWTPKPNTTGAQVLLAPPSERDEEAARGLQREERRDNEKGPEGARRR